MVLIFGWLVNNRIMIGLKEVASWWVIGIPALVYCSTSSSLCVKYLNSVITTGGCGYHRSRCRHSGLNSHREPNGIKVRAS